MKTLAIKKDIYQDPGYSLDYRLKDNELDRLRGIVEEQFFEVIEEHYPGRLNYFKELGLENYHQGSYDIDHAKLWPKLSRCLEKKACDEIKSMDFFKKLEEDFSPFMLGRVVYEREVDWERDEMYWRIVRPNEPTDVGTLHADRWFHESMKIRERVFPDGANALKIWIPLYVEPGANGLEVVEDSHKREWNFKAVDIENTMKPRLNVDESEISRKLLVTEPGQLVIFNEDLVHVGAVNRGETTRISLEITLIRTHC